MTRALWNLFLFKAICYHYIGRAFPIHVSLFSFNLAGGEGAFIAGLLAEAHQTLLLLHLPGTAQNDARSLKEWG